MKKYFAELFGTFMLVFIGCGTVIFSADTVGHLGIAFAFGLAIVAIAYSVGNISGGHVNPAVSLGVYCAGRMSLKDMLGYIVFQFIGATLAAYVLLYIALGHLSGFDVAAQGLGQNGWGLGYVREYSLLSALLFEFIATFIFVKVILQVTVSHAAQAGLVIGFTLLVIHILGLQITGVSVNPARSFGPALVVGGLAWKQLWLFLITPAVAGILAGLTSRCCECSKKSKKK